MNTIMGICKDVADICATARPKWPLDGEWTDLVQSTLETLARTYNKKTLAWDGETFIEKTDITSEKDVPVFDEDLVRTGMIWRWLKRHNLAYDEEYNEYCSLLNQRVMDEDEIQIKSGYITRDEDEHYWWWQKKPHISPFVPRTWVANGEFILVNPKLFRNFPEIPDEEWNTRIIRIV